jgi:hypothetical protein
VILNPFATVRDLRAKLASAIAGEQRWMSEAIDLRDQLAAIERQRSETTRRGNLTRYAKRRAERDAMTARLAAEAVAEQVQF